MNTLIWYPRCSTCKNAKRYLDERNVKYNLRDIKEDRLSVKELEEIINLSKKDIKCFFNTSGLVYKKLRLKDKLPNMTSDEKTKLLASDGMLVKRPIFIYDNNVLIGFKKDNWEEIIK